VVEGCALADVRTAGLAKSTSRHLSSDDLSAAKTSEGRDKEIAASCSEAA
jgi:hypothetical protein